MSRSKILFIEDDPWWMGEFRGVFHKHPDLKHFAMLEASSLPAARDILSRSHGIELIALDGILHGTTIGDSIHFVEKMRCEGYEKPIVAASSSRNFRNRLVKAGCTHEYPKTELIEGIAKILLVKK